MSASCYYLGTFALSHYCIVLIIILGTRYTCLTRRANNDSVERVVSSSESRPVLATISITTTSELHCRVARINKNIKLNYLKAATNVILLTKKKKQQQRQMQARTTFTRKYMLENIERQNNA